MLNDFTKKKEFTPAEQEKAILSVFLHELALLLLAEVPLKGIVREKTKSLRGEILYRLKPEEREPYLKSRDAVLGFARQMSTAKNLDQIALALDYIQDLGKGEVYVVKEEFNQVLTNGEQA